LRKIAKLQTALAAGMAATVMILAGSPASAADAALIAAARKEGHVVWYTTQIVDPFVLTFSAAF